jgi:hypothetical protein
MPDKMLDERTCMFDFAPRTLHISCFLTALDFKEVTYFFSGPAFFFRML